MNRREVIGAVPAAILLAQAGIAKAASGKKGVMLMNRIAPATSDLMIANLDGTGERKLLAEPAYDYNASFSPRGDRIVFTSERNGDGNSDLFMAHPDGTGVRALVAAPSMDDVGAVSPDGRYMAFVSTRNGFKANIWVLELKNGKLRQLTGTGNVKGNPDGPDTYFRPAWSPDSKWIAFSSDRDTVWRGHDGGHGWEHTQELSIYVIQPDGTGFRQVSSRKGWCQGSPTWSPDGKRIAFYELTVEATWGARRPEWIGRVDSQIVSVDVASGARIEHTNVANLKVAPQFITNDEIGYLIKGGADEGVGYTSGRPGFKRKDMRNPSWTPDGRSVLYEAVSFYPARKMDKALWSWDGDWDYRFTDVFPTLSRQGVLAITEKQTGATSSSIVTMKPDGTGRKLVFDAAKQGLNPVKIKQGLAGAFQPAWSPDGEWIAFGLGGWFNERSFTKATLMRVRPDGSGAEALTDGRVHSGFPSYSADGKQIVFRVWGQDDERGLRILDLDTRQVRTLTTEHDNLPGWSPDGQRIVFTRNVGGKTFQICSIRPDGSDPKQLTHSKSSNGHAVWTADGRIMWSGSEHGFRDEAALYDNTFQQYGQIYIMDADGGNYRLLTDSKWEDSMPLYIPGMFL
ncbi:PD40 domain-containing protein [Sphingomonas sp. OK281]|uniref:PD40 domain-containing protein n=1 Tax=Sphingomonas sp. OK281 TaxID=1881067 RepID=UPI0008E961B3|nr:PD40 domain-containing protein [Sphingomonas sp. OK281]SFO33575.1 component of the Tol biopolymer transport system [Sphingomonas sp. OK281]